MGVDKRGCNEEVRKIRLRNRKVVYLWKTAGKIINIACFFFQKNKNDVLIDCACQSHVRGEYAALSYAGDDSPDVRVF